MTHAVLRRRLWSALVVLCLAAIAPASLAAPAPSPAQQETLRRVENYLNDIRSMHATFVQFAEDGSVASGDLYLRRPGRLRFAYTPPTPILIVATGRTLVFFDAELDQVTYLPLSATPLAFLVADRFSFARDDIEVTRIQEDPGAISITIIDPENPGEGQVSLVFSDAPLALRQWVVVDAQGRRTTVALSDMRTNLALDDALFQFVDPNPFRNSDPEGG